MLELIWIHLCDLTQYAQTLRLAEHAREGRALPQVISLLTLIDERAADLRKGPFQQLLPPVGITLIDTPLLSPAKQDVPRLFHHRPTQPPSDGMVIDEATRSSTIVPALATIGRTVDLQPLCGLAVMEHRGAQRVPRGVPTSSVNRVIEVQEHRHRHLDSTLR
jgi:hypothetical protein